MLIYFVQWIIISALLSSKGRNRKLYIIIAGIIYVFFATFRDVTVNQGLDAYAYFKIFNNADVNLLSYLKISNVEFGYSIVSWIIKNIFGNYYIFLFMGHTFIFCAYTYFLNNMYMYKNRLVVAAICLDLFSAYYLFRNIMAVGFILIMLVQLSKKNYKFGMLNLFLAISVHYSAIIMIPVLVFSFLLDNKERMSKQKILFYTVLSMAGTIGSFSIIQSIFAFSGKYYVYQNAGEVPVGTLICTLFVLYFSYKRFRKLIEEHKNTRILIITASLTLIVFLLELQFSIMYRALLYFIPVLFILLTYLQEVYKKSNTRYIIKVFATVYLIYQIYVFFTDVVQYIGIPYVSIII